MFPTRVVYACALYYRIHKRFSYCARAFSELLLEEMATYATPGERPPVGLPPSREAIIDQYGDEMDEALVGPVYLRLDDPAFRSYVQYANQTYEEEEAGDEELGLDLSAPPPES